MLNFNIKIYCINIFPVLYNQIIMDGILKLKYNFCGISHGVISVYTS